MDASVLCEIIGIPPRIVRKMEEKATVVRQQQTYIRQLTQSGRAEQAHGALAQALGEDDMAMLACQMEAAALYYDRYRALGVNPKILTDTLKCFSRFLAETLVMSGKDRFDRDWWTWRQVSGQLFRIGELEYEMLAEPKVISIHIPSDAAFTPGNVDASLAAAKAFFGEFFPEYAEVNYVCDSWLLSPKLKELLPETSNILSFQRRFSITHVNTENRDFIGWLFRAEPGTPAEALPEETSLQRKTKQLLLAGGNIGEAAGILL